MIMSVCVLWAFTFLGIMKLWLKREDRKDWVVVLRCGV